MKHVLFFILCLALQSSMLSAEERSGFRLHQDAAQYKGSDYANVVHVARKITLEKAFEIAESNPEIDYFVYVKGGQMALEIPPDVQFDHLQDPFGLVTEEMGVGYCRIFRHGDVIFFNKEGMWLGSAPGLADVYFKDVQ